MCLGLSNKLILKIIMDKIILYCITKTNHALLIKIKIYDNFIYNKKIKLKQVKMNVINYIRSHLYDQAVILEGGASDGNDAAQFSRLWPQGKIHAIEPNPIFKEAHQNMEKKYPNITFYPFALNDKTGEIDLRVTTGLPGGTPGNETIYPPNKDSIFWYMFTYLLRR